MIPKATKRLTPKEIDIIKQKALKIFNAAYLAQYNRIDKAIQRANPGTQAQFAAAINWEDEPEEVEKAVRKWYDNNFEVVGRDALKTPGIDLEWSDVNDSLLKTSAERATWFSRAMTETSLGQTQDVIQTWLDTEGSTIGELSKTMEGIWTGKRPQTAALTETTNLATQSQVVVGQAAGFWGYNVQTRRDDAVRPGHTAAQEKGPWPWSNTANQPPINDDFNCRCWITFVREKPEGK